ncbi:MAG: aspartate aminotransferase family protein [Promethearchaeota archaeon]
MKYEEIKNKISKIINNPVKGIPEDEMQKIYHKIAVKSPKSKAIYEDLLEMVPGGSQHQLVIKTPYVVSMKKTLGTRMWDVDDNEYIDYLMSAGACILGHSYPPLMEEMIKVLGDLDPNVYWNTEWENKAIKQIRKCVPSVEKLTYLQSGTEADMAAIRIARVFTGKDKIIKFGGSYHGWSDQLTYDIHVPYSGTLDADGIPRGCLKDTISIPPNDLQSLEETLKKQSAKRGGVAAVIVEPLGSENGAIPIQPGFNKAVRELCDKYEVLLIFDEVVTGFRLDIGGAQKYFGIKPDLTVFGKLLAHGFPSVGAVGGRRDVMDVVSGDVDEKIGSKHAFIGGTLRGNPLTAAATYWTLKLIEQENAIEKAASMADDLVKKLNQIFEDHESPYFAYNYKSIIHYETYAPVSMDIRNANNIPNALFRKKCVDDIATVMLSEGIITKYGNRGFTCLQHTIEDNDKFIIAFEKVLKLIPNY